ncbi:MAG: adenylate cyclase [Actinomycetota bacterium]|jgi:class 3 adenylate cyclase
MTRLRGWLRGSRPSPLELIVGPEQHARELWVGGLFYLSVLVVTTFLAAVLPGADIAGFRARDLGLVTGVGFLFLFVGTVFGRNWSAEIFGILILLLAPFVLLALYFAGPNAAMSVSVLPSMVATAFIFHPRPVAVLLTIQTFVLYGLLVALADGYPRPFTRWIVVAGFTLATAGLLEFVFRQLKVLADRDRANAKELRIAHAKLAEANLLLESRVTDQVGEIERLGRLRRFLTPQIAESVLSGDADSLLSTHRKRIAVFFCDLRGFTRFSASAEPEDIAEVLSEYYEVLGRAIEAHGATVGGFAGDGVWAFFNDPFPVEDPAGKAFAMALSLREPMRAMRQTWDGRGFALSYGLGIAYGYATMSTIGFETRSEYTAVGSVVNLGARLCDAAAPGELLIDARAYNELPKDIGGEPASLTLKGFNDPVTAYRVAL